MRKAKFIRCGVIELLVYCPLMFLCLHKEIWQPIVDNNQDLPWSSRLMINSRVYRGEYSQSSTSEFEICCLNIHIFELCDLFRTILICVSKFLIVYGYYESSTNAKGETADSTAIESLRISGIPQNPSESLESLRIPQNLWNPSESLRIPQNPSESLRIPQNP
jgi:hypothetical protein